MWESIEMGKLWLNTELTGHGQTHFYLSCLGRPREHPRCAQGDESGDLWSPWGSVTANGLGRKRERHLPKEEEEFSHDFFFSLCLSSSRSQGRTSVCWDGRRGHRARAFSQRVESKPREARKMLTCSIGMIVNVESKYPSCFHDITA